MALIFLMILSSLNANDQEEEGGQILRRTRDGNVMRTGCEELDSFITNLSDFTTKIVNMFYDGNKSENNDVEDKNSILGSEHEMAEGSINEDVNTNAEELPDKSEMNKIDENRIEDNGDLVHMDLLPISKNK